MKTKIDIYIKGNLISNGRVVCKNMLMGGGANEDLLDLTNATVIEGNVTVGDFVSKGVVLVTGYVSCKR